MRHALSNLAPSDYHARAKGPWHSPFVRRLATASAALLFGLPMFVKLAKRPELPRKTPRAVSPDVIVFANGDQLTGKFLRSSEGKAVFHSGHCRGCDGELGQGEGDSLRIEICGAAKGFQMKRNALPAHLPWAA